MDQTNSASSPQTPSSTGGGGSSALKSVLGVIGAVAVVGVVGKLMAGSGDSSPQPLSSQGGEGDVASAPEVPADEPKPVEIVVEGNGSVSLASSSTYKDGTYEAIGSYKSPAGPEEIKVKIILKDDVIVDSAVVGTATNPKSIRMQDAFISGYEVLVEGKELDAVNLGPVSGSSLTPKGFNDALAKIKAQAAS